jgi:hypothetical protein
LIVLRANGAPKTEVGLPGPLTLYTLYTFPRSPIILKWDTRIYGTEGENVYKVYKVNKVDGLKHAQSALGGGWCSRR